MEPKKELLVLNGCVLTADGSYRLTTLPIDLARRLARECRIVSAVGHAATAELLTDLLGVEIPARRVMVQQEPDQLALVFRLRERPAEGTVLGREELEDIGYDLALLTRRV